MADDMMSELAKGADRASRMRPPSFARAQDVLRRYGELLRVLHSLDPPAFTKIQLSFASSMSTVIRCVCVCVGGGGVEVTCCAVCRCMWRVALQ
jgi:hypothetical protein